jgi:transposase
MEVNTVSTANCKLLAASRGRSVEFGHSQSHQALHRGLWNVFTFFGGTPRELVHDNMLTAVIDRDGTVVRYNVRFLDFLRRLKI